MECNPRSTSGLHLWSNSPYLARAFTDSLDEGIELPIVPPKDKLGHTSRVQVTPGMMMWEHKSAGPKTYARHMKRLVGTRDVIWEVKDMTPSLVQPFLLTTYYQMCRETGLQLLDLFQVHLLWEPHWNEKDPEGCQLGKIRKMMLDADEKDESKGQRRGYDSASDSTLHDGIDPDQKVVEELERLKDKVKQLEMENEQLRADNSI